MPELPELFERLKGMFQERLTQQFERSWFVALRPERNARLKAILSLSAEYERNVQVSRFGSAAAKSAIEAIIEGDWKYAEECAGDLTFLDLPSADREQFAQLWEGFVLQTRVICAEARRRTTGQGAKAS